MVGKGRKEEERRFKAFATKNLDGQHSFRLTKDQHGNGNSAMHRNSVDSNRTGNNNGNNNIYMGMQPVHTQPDSNGNDLAPIVNMSHRRLGLEKIRDVHHNHNNSITNHNTMYRGNNHQTRV